MSKQFIKYLRRLPEVERQRLLHAVDCIAKLAFDTLDVKKMQGYDHRFRVRVGKFRIIFEKQNEQTVILEIDTRGDVY